MATIHHTTLQPGKLEILAAWLPAQPWYLAAGGAPQLARAGGFRLDDPDGEVGIEFMVVSDAAGPGTVSYLVPLTYRSAPLPAAEDGLIATAEHGVLGRRWIYDGVHDPVLVAQLLALIQGGAQPQAQSVSDTPDPTVTGHHAAEGALVTLTSAVTGSGPAGTELRATTVDADGMTSGQVTLVVRRVLRAGEKGTAEHGTAEHGAGQPGVTASWQQPDGSRVRGVLVTAQYTAVPAARA